MQTAMEAAGEYGRPFGNVAMAFEVVGADETEDYYVITLSYHAQGGDRGPKSLTRYQI